MKNSLSLRRFVVLVLILLFLGGALTACVSDDERSLAPPLFHPQTDQLNLGQVVEGRIAKELKGTAQMYPFREQRVMTKYNHATLVKHHLHLGEIVEPGRVIAELEFAGLEDAIIDQEIRLERAAIEWERTRIQDPEDDINIKQRLLDLEIANRVMERLLQQREDQFIRAEFRGVVTKIELVRPGDSIAPYSPIALIGDPSDIVMVYNVERAVDLVGLFLNMDAMVTIPGHGEFSGKLVHTPVYLPDQAIDNAMARLIAVMMDETPRDALLARRGEIKIVVEEQENALIVPASAVRSSGSRYFVYTFDDQVRREVDIERGIVTPDFIEIISGLEEGQIVILASDA